MNGCYFKAPCIAAIVRCTSYLGAYLAPRALTFGRRFFYLALAVVFLLAGVSRVVEIRALGLPAARRRFLSAVHVLGCVMFSAALALTAVGNDKSCNPVLSSLLLPALALLIPVHIYIGILRRVKLNRLPN